MLGTCLCSEIKFEILEASPKLYQCHCSLCRKQGGSSSNTALIAAAGGFRWLAGEEHINSYVKATGFRSDFCCKCGSPVPNPLRDTQYFWVPAGLLDDADGLEISAHFYIDSKAQWDTIPAGGVQYESILELTEFIELMHTGDST